MPRITWRTRVWPRRFLHQKWYSYLQNLFTIYYFCTIEKKIVLKSNILKYFCISTFVIAFNKDIYIFQNILGIGFSINLMDWYLTTVYLERREKIFAIKLDLNSLLQPKHQPQLQIMASLITIRKISSITILQMIGGLIKGKLFSMISSEWNDINNVNLYKNFTNST